MKLKCIYILFIYVMDVSTSQYIIYFQSDEFNAWIFNVDIL